MFSVIVFSRAWKYWLWPGISQGASFNYSKNIYFIHVDTVQNSYRLQVGGSMERIASLVLMRQLK
jgi:hypothetical protein